jgi:porphobilinogen synthase
MGRPVPERDPERDPVQLPVPLQAPVQLPMQPSAQVPLHGPLHPLIRPRRLRSTPALRRLVAETRIHPADLILPMFIREGATEAQPITSMPGVVQHSLDSFKVALDQAAAAGIGGVMLFGIPEKKDAVGSGAVDPNGILNVATRVAVETVGDALVVQTDLCLDEFTDHGHCGVLDLTSRPGTVIIDNDATLAVYREMALAQANAGSQLLGLSGMMDGQVAAVRDALDGNGFSDTAVLAYSAKYASAFYGPFREAVQSSLVGNRRSYQLDPGNRREGLREVELDIAEGADIVMVKPAMSYLDVLADTAAISTVPVWAYQVSGEYSMIEAAAANGWIDRERAVYESVLSIRRAGADAVLTYFAVELARWLNAGAL